PRRVGEQRGLGHGHGDQPAQRPPHRGHTGRGEPFTPPEHRRRPEDRPRVRPGGARRPGRRHRPAPAARGTDTPGRSGRGPPPATTQPCERLVWIATEGSGSTSNPFGPTPYRVDSANGDQSPSQIVTGFAGILGFPSERRIRALTATASAQVRPANPASPPP